MLSVAFSLLALILASASTAWADSPAGPDSSSIQTQSMARGEATASEPARGDEMELGWWDRQVSLKGDVRAALAVNIRKERDGEQPREFTQRVRLRGGAEFSFLRWLGATARLALGIDDDTDSLGFRLKHRRDIESGDLTFDELFFTLRPHRYVTIRGGRFQTAGHPFEVDSVVEDSLSRHDSGGLDIDWTDGLYITIQTPASFTLHLIGQANPMERPTNNVGVRGPLDFRSDASRLTYYMGLEAPRFKPFTQLVADVTIIPRALRPRGMGGETREDLIAFSMRAAADFPILGPQGIILHPFGEFGVMASTPRENALEVSNSQERSGSFAFVAGVDFKNLGPGSLGFQFGWAQPGYLISPDYPNNAWSMETRYEVGVAKNAVLEVRHRHREEIEKLVTTRTRQTDDNFLLRVTMKF